MTFAFARTLLFCVALALPGIAMAATTPIPGVDVIVKSHPARDLIVHTDGSGQARLEGLVPGNYTITIGGASLAAAMDRLAAPAGRNGVATPSHGRAEGFGSYGHQTVSRREIAVGDLNGDGRVDAAARGAPVIQIVVDLGSAGRFSQTAPYRRGHTGEGLALTFTIPNRGGARSGQRVATGTVTIDAIPQQGLYSTSPVSAVGQQ